jgi:hypothetical protein
LTLSNEPSGLISRADHGVGVLALVNQSAALSERGCRANDVDRIDTGVNHFAGGAYPDPSHSSGEPGLMVVARQWQNVLFGDPKGVPLDYSEERWMVYGVLQAHNGCTFAVARYSLSGYASKFEITEKTG